MLGVRTLLPEAADPQDYDPGVTPQNLVGSEPERLQLSGSHVFDQHVRIVEQRPKCRLALRGLEVK